MIKGLRRTIGEYRRNGIVPIPRAAFNWVKNRRLPYAWIPENRWKDRKTSDTLFIFGSGPSIKELTSKQWAVIKQHDSFGLNYAYLTRFPMTFYYLGYDRDTWACRHVFLREALDLYENTLWFIPTRVLPRLVHPRTSPELFPPHPKLALFEIPASIQLDSDRPFRAEDFKTSLLYRGSMGLVLQLADLLGYRRIVLLGVDLQTYKHFFDDYPELQSYWAAYERTMSQGKVFEAMIPKGNKHRTMEEYYYAVQDLYFRPKGVELYVGNSDNLLSPRIPFYPGFSAQKEKTAARA